MRKFKRFLSLVLTAVMLISMLSVSSFAANAETEGSCGDDLTWRFSPASGMLTILGEGEMHDYSYSSQAPWSQYAPQIKGVVLGSGITSVGNRAFEQCTELSSVAFPLSLTRIGDYSFSYCTSLKSVTVHNYITDLGSGAFSNCTSLEKAVIGNKITEIKSFAFAGCISLYDVKFPEDLVSIGEGAFSSCLSYENIVLPDHYIKLDSDTFMQTAYFNNAENWDGEELYLGTYLLYVKDVGQSSVVVNVGTEYIARNAMADIYDLYTVYYPKTLKEINGELFEIKYAGGGHHVDIYYPLGYGYRGCPYYGGTGSTYRTTGNCGKNATFSYNETGTVITFSGSGPLYTYDYTYDGYDTFLATPWGYLDVYITEAIIGEGITTMGQYSVPSVSKITLPNSVTHIYDNALSGSFSTITLPEKLRFIDTDSLPFSLKEISISDENATYTTENGILYSKDMKTLVRYPGSKEGEHFEIPEGVTTIGDKAFGYQKNLKTLYIPDSVTEIGRLIFDSYKDRVTIQCRPNSAAHAYAVKGGYKYELLCDHSFGDYTEVSATCTTEGYKSSVCVNGCGTVDKIITAPVLGHKFTDYKFNNDASCTANATMTASCDRGCGEMNTQEVEESALGHSFTEYEIIIEADCVHDEVKESICDRGCGEKDTVTVEGSAWGHSFTEYTDDNNADCTHNGTKTAICDNCDAGDTVETEGSALGHSFTNYEVISEPSCTEKGVKEALCDNGCGEKDRITEGSLGHSAGEWIVIEEPDYGFEGYRIQNCTVCSEVVNTETIPALVYEGFPDVAEDAWYYEGVEYCFKQGYITGTDKGTFEPEDTLTREQFVVILARVAGAKLSDYTESNFADVAFDSWYGPSVIWANTEGYVNGVGKGNFGVGAPISREELATMLYRYSNDENEYADILENYKDSADISEWARAALNWAANNGILGSTSTSAQLISPKMTVTRAQAAKIFMTCEKAVN